MSQTKFKVLHSTWDFCIANADNLFLHIWRSDIQAEHLRVFREVRVANDAKHPEGVAGLVLMCDGFKLPDSDAREEAVLLAQAINKSTKCMGIVIEKGGLISSAFRTVVSAVALAARSSYPNKFFGNLDEGSRWVLEQRGKSDIDYQPALAGIRDLRDKMLRMSAP